MDDARTYDMGAFKDIPELHATAQHLELIHRKLDKLTSAKRDSWEQILTALARVAKRNTVKPTPEELLPLLDVMRNTYGTGYSKVWNAHLGPMYAAQRVRNEVAMRKTRRDYVEGNRPNGPRPDTWVGEVGIPGPCPIFGQAVVYVLFDGLNVPVYVGSTENFYKRLQVHVREKSGITRWTAYACQDREHAYRLEDRLLKQHMPPMNRKRGR